MIRRPIIMSPVQDAFEEAAYTFNPVRHWPLDNRGAGTVARERISGDTGVYTAGTFPGEIDLGALSGSLALESDSETDGGMTKQSPQYSLADDFTLVYAANEITTESWGQTLAQVRNEPTSGTQWNLGITSGGNMFLTVGATSSSSGYTTDASYPVLVYMKHERSTNTHRAGLVYGAASSLSTRSLSNTPAYPADVAIAVGCDGANTGSKNGAYKHCFLYDSFLSDANLQTLHAALL